MAAQLGKALLLKINISGTMTTIGGMRSTSMTLNDEPVDITNKDLEHYWRQVEFKV